jgi:hypothetical protein
MNDLWIFRIAAGSWYWEDGGGVRDIPARASAGCAFDGVKATLYVHGGRISANTNTAAYRDIWRYRFSEGSWDLWNRGILDVFGHYMDFRPDLNSLIVMFGYNPTNCKFYRPPFILSLIFNIIII